MGQVSRPVPSLCSLDYSHESLDGHRPAFEVRYYVHSCIWRPPMEFYINIKMYKGSGSCLQVLVSVASYSADWSRLGVQDTAWPVVVTHFFNPGDRGRWTSECEVSLVYRGTSRTARDTQRKSVSKTNKDTQLGHTPGSPRAGKCFSLGSLSGKDQKVWG